MTRPKKEIELTRNHRITIRLTDTEFSIIENAATQADMSLSEYIRTQVLEGQVNVRFEIVADTSKIKKCVGTIYEMKYEVMRMVREFREEEYQVGDTPYISIKIILVSSSSAV